MSVFEVIKSKIKETNADYDERENRISLLVEEGSYVGKEYLVFIVKDNYKDFKKEYLSLSGNPVVIGIIEDKNSKYSLYIAVKKLHENRWREFDIVADVSWDEIDKYLTKGVGKGKNKTESIFSYLKNNHTSIRSSLDSKFQEYIMKLIETEKRVKEGGLLIAAYINYLESYVQDIKSILPKGWGGIVLQLMVFYFLHQRGKNENINELKFGVIEAYENYRDGKVEFSPEGDDLWAIFEKDLIKFNEISKDSIFTLEDYKILMDGGVMVPNEVFLGNLESMHSFRYENIKSDLDNLYELIFNKNKKKISLEQVKRELWSKFKGLGIIPIFEVRRWYEAGLTGDIIGGVYEGIKKIEERKKGGIYYTPRFIVEYIVNNTLGPYIEDIVKEIGEGKYENFEEFMESASIEELERFYNRLTSIRILDPACGTGHFLAYAMEKLTEYYWKIWEKAKDGSGKFDVEILDKNGRRTEKLVQIDKKVLPFVIRQHLILRNNIYGVDIDDYAHQIAKARMLIEVFDNYTKEVRDKGYEFPNMEMNIKTGNSLIGFASWDEVPKEEQKVIQKTLFDDFGKGESKLQKIKRLMRKAKETGNTKEYDKIITEVRELMNDVFVEHLRGKGVNIEKEQLGYGEGGLRAFHWIIEFLDVFEGDNPGFDIVVGNPPYGDKISDIELEITNNCYSVPIGSSNKAAIFTSRSYMIIRKNGLFGFILPNSIARTKEFQNVREFLLKNVKTYLISDEGAPFVEVTLEMISVFYRKIESEEEYTIKIESHRQNIPPEDRLPKLINKTIFSKLGRLVLYYDNIYEYMLSNSRINVIKGKRGLTITGLRKNKVGEYTVPVLVSGKAVNKYCIYLEKSMWASKNILTKTALQMLENELLVSTRLNQFYRAVIKPRNIIVGDNVVRLYPKIPLNNHFLAIVLNSHLMEYIAKKYLFNYIEFTMYINDICEITPIIVPSNYNSYIIISKFLHFLTPLSYPKRDLLIYISNMIVYELYLKGKFHEDELYPEAKNYLLEAVAKHLKPINYDRWAELYWKKQLEDNLTEGEEKELEKLEQENLKTVEEVYNSLKEDKEVQAWVEKIKSHEWVKIIEGETQR